MPVVSGDCENGHGKWEGANGETYEGQFQEGRYNGTGTLTFASGATCEGQ